MFICLGGYFIFAYATTAKIRLTLLLLFPILIVGQIVIRFIEAEPANTFAEAIGGDTISKPIEGARNVVGVNLIISVIRVRAILQTIHRVGQNSKFRVCDCQFDFV
jgi:hypothetical protein